MEEVQEICHCESLVCMSGEKQTTQKYVQYETLMQKWEHEMISLWTAFADGTDVHLLQVQLRSSLFVLPPSVFNSFSKTEMHNFITQTKRTSLL
jgi:hypothetical protein